MTGAKYLLGFILVLAEPSLEPATAEAGGAPLGAYKADIGENSIFGISSGAFMAVRFAIAWSGTIKGVGIIAGDPYYCSQNTGVGGLTGSIGAILTATSP